MPSKMLPNLARTNLASSFFCCFLLVRRSGSMNPRRRLFVTIFAALLFFAPALGGISTDFHNADTDALLTRPRPLPLGHLDVSPGIERVWSASNDPGLSKRACNRSIRRDPVPRRVDVEMKEFVVEEKYRRPAIFSIKSL